MSVNNTATATGKNPAGATVTSPTSSTSTPVNQTSALTLTKSAAVTDVNADGKTDLGDKITWSFLVKNTGTVTLTTVAITDAKAGAVTCPVTTLAPGASTTCTATTAYTITQADVDAGVVSNTATAAAKNPANADGDVQPVVDRHAGRTDTRADAHQVRGGHRCQRRRQDTNLGDKITWSFLVKNTGTVTVTTTAITDAKAGAVTCPVTTLAPGAQTTCTATTAYVITQADVDAGVVNNTATASAKNPSGTTITSTPSSTSTPVNQVSSLLLTKSAAVTDVNANGKTDLGDKIAWSFLVKNTGTVTVTTTAISDAKAGATTCPVTTLAPGASTTCTATTAYTITQADVDAGVVNNTATATAKSPSGATVTSPTSSTSTPVNQVSSLLLTKSAAVTDVNGDGKTNLGDKIAWSFLVKNTGTVTVTTTAISDAKAGATTCPVTTLAPGASTTCTATTAYTITQADVDNGVVSNTATATAKNPANVTVTSNTSQTDTPVNQAPALQLTKSAAVTDVNGDGKTNLGDKITWSFLVKNTGTVSLNTLAISDAKAGATTCPVTTLAPGASTTCTATTAYVITQADVDAGVVNNTATASTKNPAGTTLTSNPSSTSTPVVQTASAAADQVGCGHRRQRRRQDEPGRQDHLVVPREEHRHHDHHDHGGQRREGGGVALPGHHPGARRLHDLYGHNGLRHHPGRRRQRRRQQHRGHDRQGPGQRDGHVQHLADGHTGHPEQRAAADEVGGGHGCQRQRGHGPGRQDRVVVPGQEHRFGDRDHGRGD